MEASPTSEPVSSRGIAVLIMRPVEAVAALLVLALTCLILAGTLFRYALNTPLYWSDEVATLIFLWLSMLGAVIAIHRNEHLRLNLVLNLLNERQKALANTLSLMVMAVFLAALVMPSIHHMQGEAIVISPMLSMPMSIKVSALVAGIVLMLALVLIQLVQQSSVRDIVVSAVVIGAIGGVLFLLTPIFAGLGQGNILVFLLGATFLCLVIGTPIAFCFGLGSMAFLVFSTSIPLSVMVGRMDQGMSNITLLAVPSFLLLGAILDATGMGRAIVTFVASMLGHVRAGMSYVLLGSMYLVSGISGSKVSDMATVAPALFPEMQRRGSKPPEMVGLLGAGAVMADTVPPSIVLIVIGSIAGVSVGALFTSGFVIAAVLMLVIAVFARWRARNESMEGVQRASWSVVRTALVVAAPTIVLPFIIRFAVGEGIATATEVAAIAVFYALLIGIFVYERFSLRRFYEMLIETAALSGSIMLILGTALAMAWVLTQTGFAFRLSQFVAGLPGGWISFMALSVLIFVLLGCFLEGLPALVLLAPLMFPIAKSLGIHGVHYSMVVVVAMNVGLFLPPLGIGFYLACSIGKVPPDQAIRPMWAYIVPLLLGLLLIAAVPAISIGYL